MITYIKFNYFKHLYEKSPSFSTHFCHLVLGDAVFGTPKDKLVNQS